MKLLRRIDYWIHTRRRDAELADELEFHRQMSNVPIGNVTLAREDARAVWIWPWLESVSQDVRYAFRNLRRRPGFTAVALLTLGTAIGLNTSLFTVYNAVALRPWSVKDPSRVVKVLAKEQRRGGLLGFSLPEYRYFAAHSKSLAGVSAMSNGLVRLGYERPDQSTYASFVSANYFDVLGLPMQLGRGFRADENLLDAPQNVAVLSFGLWRDHFGSDLSVLGKQLSVDDVPFIVVGVTEEDFTGTSPGREDIWMPLAAMQSLRPNNVSTRAFLRSNDTCCSDIIGRLAPGSTRARAQAELNVLSRQFRAEMKDTPGDVLLYDPILLAGHSKRKDVIPVFVLLFAGVTMVLLLACANVSNLLLARAAARRHEIEVRRALGAGRARIVRQLLTEGSVLALAAAVLGLALAAKLPAAIFAWIGDGPNVHLKPDFNVVAYAVALAAVTCLAFALVPALHGTRSGNHAARLHLRSVLIAAQLAFSVVLLVGALLMLSGVTRARDRDPGYRIRDVAVITIDLPAGAYDPPRLRHFHAHLSQDLGGLSSSSTIGVTARAPLDRSGWSIPVRLPGEPPNTAHSTEFQEISPAYFDVLGIPILAGRNFQPGDAGAIVINQALARRYFENEDPVGKALIVDRQAREIVGVARDASLSDLDDPGPMFFEPFTGNQPPRLLVRATDAGALDQISAIARQIEPRAHIYSTPLSDNLDRVLRPSSTGAEIAGMLGVFALALAAIGMSGVFAFIVESRTKEIGIRMALGAAPRQVITLVLSGTARAVTVGLAVGYAATGAFAKFVAGYLYGVSPFDPRAYVTAGAVLAIAGLAAAFVPARRATRIDPMIALRVD